MNMNILDQINHDKYAEVAMQKQKTPVRELMAYPLFNKAVPSFSEYVASCNRSGIIAEYKRKSPSKGFINENADLKKVVLDYQNAGASAISILTNAKYFGGSIDDLLKAASVVEIPLLRKEFVVDEYQIYEAKAFGASAILLIAESLAAEKVAHFAKTAREIGLEVLCEVHHPDELAKITDDVNVVGVNNRDLKTFEVDLNRSVEISSLIPSRFVKISESGISSPDAIKKLRECGFQGFLMGEYFMKQQSQGDAMRQFLAKIKR